MMRKVRARTLDGKPIEFWYHDVGIIESDGISNTAACRFQVGTKAVWSEYTWIPHITPDPCRDREQADFQVLRSVFGIDPETIDFAGIPVS